MINRNSILKWLVITLRQHRPMLQVTHAWLWDETAHIKPGLIVLGGLVIFAVVLPELLFNWIVLPPVILVVLIVLARLGYDLYEAVLLLKDEYYESLDEPLVFTGPVSYLPGLPVNVYEEPGSTS